MPVEAFSVESTRFMKQLTCENVGSTNILESRRTEATGTQESYFYLQAQFSHYSQRALGKHLSWRLTLKTKLQH